MNRTQVSDFFQEEHMPLCKCDA